MSGLSIQFVSILHGIVNSMRPECVPCLGDARYLCVELKDEKRKEEGKKGKREGREGGKKEGRKGGREGGRKEGREGGREGGRKERNQGKKRKSGFSLFRSLRYILGSIRIEDSNVRLSCRDKSFNFCAVCVCTNCFLTITIVKEAFVLAKSDTNSLFGWYADVYLWEVKIKAVARIFIRIFFFCTSMSINI